MTIEDIVLVALILEGVVGVLITFFNVREIRFLRRLRPYLPPEDDLPLYDALVKRAIFVAATGAYLIVLTMIGALVGPLATYFPPLRAINGLLFLVLLAGPIILGNAMRRRPNITMQIDEES